jgi:hypothetical protein
MTKKSISVLHYLIFLFLVILIVFLRLQSLGEPLERDLTSHAYTAHRLLAGGLLYVDIWNHKPPGIYGAYMLSELLWGYGPRAVAYIGISFTLISLVFLYLFLTKLAGARVALVGSFFWALVSNSFLIQANQPNVEVFMNAFLMISLWALVMFYERDRFAFLFLSGLFFAVSSTFKTIALFPFLAIAFYLVFSLIRKKGGFDPRECATRIFWFAVPGLIVWGLVFLYFAVVGRFGVFWEAVFNHNVYYSGNMASNFWNFFTKPQFFNSPMMAELRLLAVLSFLWFFFSRKEYGPLGRFCLIALFVGTVVELISPGQFYMHYYQLLLPILAIFPALFISDLYRILSGRSRAAALSVVIVFFLASTGYLVYYQAKFLRMTPNEVSIKKYGPGFLQSKRMGLYIKERTGPCETVYEWGKDTGMAAPIIFISHFYEGSPKGMVERRKITYESVVANPPAYLIYNMRTRWVDDKIFDALIEKKYKLIGSRYMRYIVYEKKDRGTDGRGDCKGQAKSMSAGARTYG